MRYFRAINVETYEAIRSQLDAAYGYPNAETKTVSAIPAAADADADGQGRVYLAASPAECEYPAVAAILPQLLAAGVVEEVSASEYAATFPPLPYPA